MARSALGKSFMLRSELIDGGAGRRPTALAPKIVSFELQGDQVAMLERDLSDVYSELPSTKLVQTFALMAQDQHTVTLSWQQGLEVISTRSPYVVSDLLGAAPDAVTPRETVLKVKSTFVRNSQVVDNGLELEQVSRVEHADTATRQESTVTLRTRIVPYTRNEHFEPRASTQQVGVGYFETAHLQSTSGAMQLQATRWDARPEVGPITYLISRQTPQQWVPAITEGVLYWNKVAGRDLVRVQTEADPNQMLRGRQVMIHWVAWASADAAVAQLLPDPATGEILQGSIFLPSRFADFSAETATQQALAHNVGPHGFGTAEACAMDHAAISPLTNAYVRHDMDLAQRAAADGLRTVVAHEVGHTLGLRHNFAASGQSALPDHATQQVALTEYLRHSTHRGVATASSVMDYLSGDDELMLGAYIRHDPLPYDVAAIQWGYSPVGVRVQDLNPPPFCTDKEKLGGQVLGCDVGDSGPQPLATSAKQLSQHNQVADTLLLALMRTMRAGDDTDTHALAHAMEKTANDLTGVPHLHMTDTLFTHLAKGASVLEVDRRLASTRWLEPERYTQETADALDDAVQQAGGLAAILTAAYPTDEHDNAPKTGWLSRALLSRLHDEPGRHNPWGLTTSDRHALEESLPAWGALVEQRLLQAVLLNLTGYRYKQPQFAPGVVRPDRDEQLADIARHIIFDTDGTRHGLPQPRFALKVRMAAVRLFSEELFGAPYWLYDQRVILSADLAVRLQEAPHAWYASHQPRDEELRRWEREELLVKSTLDTVH